MTQFSLLELFRSSITDNGIKVVTRRCAVKRKLQDSYFPVNFVKLLRIHFLKNTSGDCFLTRAYFIHRTNYRVTTCDEKGRLQ